MQDKLRKKFVNKGINFVDLNTVYLSSDTEIGKNRQTTFLDTLLFASEENTRKESVP